MSGLTRLNTLVLMGLLAVSGCAHSYRSGDAVVHDVGMNVLPFHLAHKGSRYSMVFPPINTKDPGPHRFTIRKAPKNTDYFMFEADPEAKGLENTEVEIVLTAEDGAVLAQQPCTRLGAWAHSTGGTRDSYHGLPFKRPRSGGPINVTIRVCNPSDRWTTLVPAMISHSPP